MDEASTHSDSVVLSRSFDLWVEIGAPRDEVFEALTDGARLREWWTDEADVEGRIEGRVRYVWNQGGSAVVAEAVVVEWQRPERFAVKWRSANGQEIEEDGDNMRGARWPVVQTYRLSSPSPGVTRLHLHDTGVSPDPAYDEVYAATREGWVQSLSRLKSYCEAAGG